MAEKKRRDRQERRQEFKRHVAQVNEKSPVRRLKQRLKARGRPR